MSSSLFCQNSPIFHAYIFILIHFKFLHITVQTPRTGSGWEVCKGFCHKIQNFDDVINDSVTHEKSQLKFDLNF